MVTFDHEYPATKLLWLPDKSAANPDLLATSGDYLRLWEVDETGKNVTQKAVLNEVRTFFILTHILEFIMSSHIF